MLRKERGRLSEGDTGQAWSFVVGNKAESLFMLGFKMTLVMGL